MEKHPASQSEKLNLKLGLGFKHLHNSLLSMFGVETKSFVNRRGKKYFCAPCKTLCARRINNVLSHPERIKGGIGLEVTLLGKPDSWDIYKCPLCQLFNATVRYSSRLSGIYYLYAFSCPTGEEQSSNSRELENAETGQPILLLLIDADSAKYTHRSRDLFAMAEHDSGNLLIAPVPLQGQPPLASQGATHFRQVNAEIESSILKDWVDTCRNGHDCQASSQGIFQTDVALHLRFIDCLDHRIVPAEPQCKYVALSYVWGNSNVVGQKLQIQFPALPERLPDVIEDAVKVVQHLGMQYLWVDRYCINQDNEDERQFLIRNMDIVYKC